MPLVGFPYQIESCMHACRFTRYYMKPDKIVFIYKNNLDPTKLWIGANGAWFWAQWAKCSFVDFHPTSPNHTCCISKWENSSASDFTLFLNGICCTNSMHCITFSQLTLRILWHRRETLGQLTDRAQCINSPTSIDFVNLSEWKKEIEMIQKCKNDEMEQLPPQLCIECLITFLDSSKANLVLVNFNKNFLFTSLRFYLGKIFFC